MGTGEAAGRSQCFCKEFIYLCTSPGIHRHGDDAVPSSERHGGADRAARARLHPLRALQQGERATVARLQRENGPRVWLELPHIAHERRANQVTLQVFIFFRVSFQYGKYEPL